MTEILKVLPLCYFSTTHHELFVTDRGFALPIKDDSLVLLGCDAVSVRTQ